MEPVHPAVAAAARHATPSPPTPAAPVVVAPVAAAATAAAGLAPGGVALDVQIAVAVVMAQLLVAALWYILRINSGVLRAAGHSRSPRPRKTEPEPFIVPPAAATPVPTPTPPAAVEGKPVPEFAARPAVQPGQKAPAQFVALMDKSFQRILASIKETEWNPMTREDGISISYLPDPSRPDRYRASTIIKAPPEVVLRAMFDMSLRANWDAGMVGDRNRTVAYFDDSISITYYRVGNVGTVSSRDFLDLRGFYRIKHGAGGYLLIMHSVDWHQQPAVDGVVRAHNHPTAQLIRRLPNNDTELTHFVQSDLRGWLSTGIIRMAISGSLLRMFKNLHTYCEASASSLMMDADEIERYVAASAKG